MIKTIELGNYRKVRIWTGELPKAAYKGMETLTHEVAAEATPTVGPQLAALEFLAVFGSRHLYGLIGGEFDPRPTSRLRLDFVVSSNSEMLFDDCLARKLDEVRVGLPKEYSGAVVAGADLASSGIARLAAGKLTINRAAHGAVGSCNLVYENLTFLLIRLFNAIEPSRDDLERLSKAR